jgi:AsmA-like C-terminal region
MRWIKLIAGLLLVFFIGLAALLSFILATYDNEDYRYALMHVVHRITGGTLIIKGGFSVEPSLEPSISASEIRFIPAAGGGEARIDRFEIQFKLLPLLDEMLWIRRLTISSAVIDLPMNIGDVDASPDMFFLVPVVEYASLHNVVFRYHRPDAEDTIKISMQDLSIAPDSTSGLLFIEGAGQIDGYHYQLEGRAGKLGELMQPSRPYPLDMTLRFENGQLTVDGTVGKLAEGGDMDVRLSAEIAKLARVLRLFRYRVPELGRFTGTARLTGNFQAPSVSELQLDLAREDALALHATGSVQHLLSGGGTAIQFSGSVDDRAILTWALPDDLPPVDSLELAGNLSRPKHWWMIREFRAALSGPNGLSLRIDGQTGIARDFNAPQPFRKMDLNLRFASSTTNAARPFVPKFFPEMGAVRLTARLIAPSEEDLALEDIDAHIGDGSLRFGLRGRIGKMPIDPKIPNSGLDFDLSLEVDSSRALRRMFDYSLPDIGPVTMKAHWQGSRLRSSLDRISVHAGDPKSLTIDVDGNMQLGDVAGPAPIKESSGSIRLSATTTGALAPLLGDNLPELGAINAKAMIHGGRRALSLSDIVVKTKQQRPVQLRIEGTVARIPLGGPQAISGIALPGRMHADRSSTFVAALGGPKIPDFGPTKATFELTGSADALALNRVNVIAGSKDGLNISAQGKIGRIGFVPKRTVRQLDFQLTARAPTLQSLSTFVGRSLPDQGPVEVTAQLRDRSDGLMLDNLRLLIGTRVKPLLRATGTVEDRSAHGVSAFRAVFETSTASVLAYLFDRSMPDLGPMKVDLVMVDGSHGFDAQSLAIAGGKPDWFQFDARQVQRFPDRVFQTDFSMKALSVVNPVLDTNLPELGPIAISGRLTPGFEQGRFQGDITLGKTKMSSDLVAEFTGTRRALSGTVRMPVLYRADFFGKADATHKRGGSAASKEQLFSLTPLPFDALRMIDLGLAIEADAVQGYSERLGAVTFTITVNQGRLPKLRNWPGSNKPLLVSTDIRTSGTPHVAFRISQNHTDLRSVLARNGGSAQDGELYLSADLTSFGRSPHELVSRMNGRFGIVMENGEIASAELDLISLNLLRWLFTYATDEREKVNCAVARFDVKEGIATSDIFYLDTPTLAASGKATINFAAETVDMIVSTQPKKTLLPAGLPLKISGALEDPKTTSIPLEEAAKSYGDLIFHPFKVSKHAVAYLLALVGVEGKDDDNGACKQLKGDMASNSR